MKGKKERKGALVSGTAIEWLRGERKGERILERGGRRESSVGNG